MRIQSSKGRAIAALLIAALAVFGLAGTAQAKLTGNYTKFAQCPYKSAEVRRCLFSVTSSGEVVLGSKKVPIVNPVTLQAGVLKPVEGTAHAVAATNGVTLAPVPQPVPGGLAGLVNCKEIKEPFLRFACELTFENGLTGLNSTLELARPASEITINETNLIGEEGPALKLPVKVRLENPFLGSSCYVGSSSSPIKWELTSGETNPPPPNTKIFGTSGTLSFLEEGRIAVLKGTSLVDNAWAAPGASGCGGFLVELVLDPIINAAAGLPATAGHNTAILKNEVNTTTAAAVKTNDEENP
ncbi:MAG TPA: hypothetical protein VH042_08160 [Solirubrobacterales bacterium]|jgi:hypothetical protein|nr:hypothetical protein [Solirubrobacterales bacterium]